MGIFDALTTAVAGLQAQSFALQNISGNVANSDVLVQAQGPITFNYGGNTTNILFAGAGHNVTFSTDDPAGGPINFTNATDGLSTLSSLVFTAAAGVSLGGLSAGGNVTVTAGTRTVAADIAFGNSVTAGAGTIQATAPRSISIASGKTISSPK